MGQRVPTPRQTGVRLLNGSAAAACGHSSQAGLLRFSVKEGEGEAWSEHRLVAAPRLFVYWSEPDLRAVVQQSGWTEIQLASRAPGQGDDRWLGDLGSEVQLLAVTSAPLSSPAVSSPKCMMPDMCRMST